MFYEFLFLIRGLPNAFHSQAWHVQKKEKREYQTVKMKIFLPLTHGLRPRDGNF